MLDPSPAQLSWDAEIDTPATIAVVGAGSCGVEAALYGRFLGYSVELYDSKKIGDELLVWGDRPLGVPWREAATSLGLAALEAHGRSLPGLDQVPSCEQYVHEYLLPLARCDLLHDSVNVKTQLVSVSRLGCGNRDNIPVERRADQEFRLLLSSEQRGEFSQVVDIVLDCSGIESSREHLATGGGRPAGWASINERLWTGKFNLRGKHAKVFSGKRLLMVGNDECAAANALQWNETASEGGRLFWVVPKRLSPPACFLDLPLTGLMLTDEEAASAEMLFKGHDSSSLVSMAAWGIESVQRSADELTVRLQINEEESVDVSVDWIIHCGTRLKQPNYHHCLNLSIISGFLSVTQEPHFYRLGDCAVNSPGDPFAYRRCGFSEMQQQIRSTYALIGGRSELNLFESVKPQLWD
jgi:hypothetical protein